MPAIVALPQVVEELLVQFGDIFPNEPARVHFAEYITGLLVAEHKTVSGIAREFADAPDQSCLNRFLTESPWEPSRLNQQRLEWLQHDPTTCYRQDGVIPGSVHVRLSELEWHVDPDSGHSDPGIALDTWIVLVCAGLWWRFRRIGWL